MKWALVFSILLPYVAANFPDTPYKRFVSPHGSIVWPKNSTLQLQEPRADNITWGPCPGSTDDHIQCGYYEVPLDWANSASGNARLAVAVYPSTKSPRKGALLSNPGLPSPVILQRVTSANSPRRWSWWVRYRPYSRLRSSVKQHDGWILRYCLMGPEGCRLYNVSFSCVYCVYKLCLLLLLDSAPV